MLVANKKAAFLMETCVEVGSALFALMCRNTFRRL